MVRAALAAAGCDVATARAALASSNSAALFGLGTQPAGAAPDCMATACMACGDTAAPLTGLTCGHGLCGECLAHAAAAHVPLRGAELSRTRFAPRAAVRVLASWPPRCQAMDGTRPCAGFLPTQKALEALPDDESRAVAAPLLRATLLAASPLLRCAGCPLLLQLQGAHGPVVRCGTCDSCTCASRGESCAGEPHAPLSCEEHALWRAFLTGVRPDIDAAAGACPRICSAFARSCLLTMHRPLRFLQAARQPSSIASQLKPRHRSRHSSRQGRLRRRSRRLLQVPRQPAQSPSVAHSRWSGCSTCVTM